MVYGLLMQHVEGGFSVSWAHHARSVVDCWRKESIGSLIHMASISGRIQKWHLASTHVTYIAVGVGGRKVSLSGATPVQFRSTPWIRRLIIIIPLKKRVLWIRLIHMRCRQYLLTMAINESLLIQTHFIFFLFLYKFLNLLFFSGDVLILLVHERLWGVSCCLSSVVVVGSRSIVYGAAHGVFDVETRAECAFLEFFVEFFIFDLVCLLLLFECVFLLSLFHSLLKVIVWFFKPLLIPLIIFVLHLIPAGFIYVKSILTAVLGHSVWILFGIFGFHHFLI